MTKKRAHLFTGLFLAVAAVLPAMVISQESSAGPNIAPPTTGKPLPPGAVPTLVTPTATVTMVPVIPLPMANTRLLTGFVDLHAHPMANLAFGGKLVHGGNDVGSLLPTDTSCNHNVRASSMQHALGNDNPSHGGWGAFDNTCGDDIRKAVIHTMQDQLHGAHTRDKATGAPDFADWPRWDDVTHQKMWIDWIRRAWSGGLRVMVSLATNNATLAAAVDGPGDGPGDDVASANLQITELKALVGRHTDFMEIAYSAADIKRIVQAGKLAIVLGVEIDNIGNFNKVATVSNAMVTTELDRLYAQGIRYIFPIHVIDNRFGATAVYTGGFNMSNYREAGHFWNLVCSPASDHITYNYTPDGFDVAVAAVKATKLGIDIARNPPTPPTCGPGSGHMNDWSLTPIGEFAIKEMMKRGMLIDIDHMSQKSANRTLELAEGVTGGGYPVSSGHNGFRGNGGSENNRTALQYQRIARLHGMAGVGSEAADAQQWMQHYATVLLLMGNGGAMMGTDLNGLVRAPKPRAGSAVRYDASFPKSSLGSKTWDYNVDGVAHYGMLADWVRDMRTVQGGNALVDDYLMGSADYFWHTWEKCETQRTNVR